jgi:DUF4097 and DUF4098 domain-containing protein YvlB
MIVTERFRPFLVTRHDLQLARLAASAILSAALLAGCMVENGVEGSFERTLNVTGPVQLEVTSGSGDVRISQGISGRVEVRGEIHAHGWSRGDSRDKLAAIEASPPISQENNLIRVGGAGPRTSGVSIDYSIEVPANTELHSVAGSGDVVVRGIGGPATFTSGSGDITASAIGNDVQALAGSGDVKISSVQGQVQVTTGSGDIEVHSAKGAVRIHTGSGDVQMDDCNGEAVADTGSGDVQVSGAHADLRVHTSSGGITVDGNPGASNYWDFQASSGDVSLHVPANASFRLYAHSSSGDIDAKIPIVMEGTSAKHELRARIGDGEARVEVETSSGKITLH